MAGQEHRTMKKVLATPLTRQYAYPLPLHFQRCEYGLFRQVPQPHPLHENRAANIGFPLRRARAVNRKEPETEPGQLPRLAG